MELKSPVALTNGKVSKGLSRTRRGSDHVGPVVVAAIDFGTTCTGYAYYLRRDHGTRLAEINIDQAWHGSAEMGLQAPTTVLMDTGKRFHSFGFEAESKYKTLTLKNEHNNWYFFQHFKMKLHHEQDLNRDMMLEDAGGKKMKAMLVFTEAIKYVKKHLLTKLKEGLREDINLREISWVITVPAIWRNSAKQFMRESASRAGIPNDQLTLALEPESAAIFCKELALNRVDGVEGAFLRAFDPGEKYIVVDCGGGTVDTTGHEVLQDGTLKELHAATGGPWGGQLVNKAFEQYIEKMVSKPVMDVFIRDCASDWIEFQKDFEKKKRQFSPSTEEVDLNFPVELETMFLAARKYELKERLQEKEYKKSVELVKHSLILKAKVMEDLFDHAIKEIKHHIEVLLKKKELKTVSTLLLVGGFSESPTVRAAMRKYFHTLRVIAPANGSVAILKGAVMFGNDSKVIAARISPYTYGVHTRKQFDPVIHPEDRKRNIKGKIFVDNVFDKHIEYGEHMYVGGKSKERKYLIFNKRNPSVFWNVYQSEERDPMFCDEPGCKFLGKLAVALPKDMTVDQVTIHLTMTCRGTELEAVASIPHFNLQCAAIFDFFEDDAVPSNDDIYEIIE
ncbi:Heat shock 70 kDa protein 12A [Mactra antiquata]